MGFARLRRYCLLGALVLSGCGESPAGRPVSGEVTFQGKPLDRGSIVFSPTQGQGTLSGGAIKDGRYVLPAEHGLAPGRYDVRISSPEGGAPDSDAPPGGDAPVLAKERIPSDYNAQTTLTAEVTAEGENRFDYQIP